MKIAGYIALGALRALIICVLLFPVVLAGALADLGSNNDDFYSQKFLGWLLGDRYS